MKHAGLENGESREIDLALAEQLEKINLKIVEIGFTSI